MSTFDVLKAFRSVMETFSVSLGGFITYIAFLDSTDAPLGFRFVSTKDRRSEPVPRNATARANAVVQYICKIATEFGFQLTNVPAEAFCFGPVNIREAFHELMCQRWIVKNPWIAFSHATGTFDVVSHDSLKWFCPADTTMGIKGKSKAEMVTFMIKVCGLVCIEHEDVPPLEVTPEEICVVPEEVDRIMTCASASAPSRLDYLSWEKGEEITFCGKVGPRSFVCVLPVDPKRRRRLVGMAVGLCGVSNGKWLTGDVNKSSEVKWIDCRRLSDDQVAAMQQQGGWTVFRNDGSFQVVSSPTERRKVVPAASFAMIAQTIQIQTAAAFGWCMIGVDQKKVLIDALKSKADYSVLDSLGNYRCNNMAFGIEK